MNEDIKAAGELPQSQNAVLPTEVPFSSSCKANYKSSELFQLSTLLSLFFTTLSGCRPSFQRCHTTADGKT